MPIHKSKSTHLIEWMSRFDRLLFVWLLAIFVLSPLPLGSDRGWAYLSITGICLSLLAFYLLLNYLRTIYENPKKTLNIDCSSYFILIVGIWFFIQSHLYFPYELLAFISPVSDDIYSSAYKILNNSDISHSYPISLDTGQTCNKALLTLACFSLILLMGKLINSRQRLVIFCYTLILSGVFQAAFGALMVLTGKEYLFFTPKTTYLGNATGTFVNRNNLAGYLEMTLAVGIGLLLGLPKVSSTGIQHRWQSSVRFALKILFSQVALLRSMLIVMVIGLLMTHSRMGNAAFFNALLITGGIALISSRQFRKPGFFAILISIVLVDIYLLGSMFDLDKVMARIEKSGLATESRDEVVRSALTMIPDFWLTGSGAGTFAYIFPAYKQEYIFGFYDLAHNDYLQIFLEAGLIGALPLLFYLLLALKRSLALVRQHRSRLLAGIGFSTIMTVISLLIHSSVDFNLQIPANIILFVAILALPWIALNISESLENNS